MSYRMSEFPFFLRLNCVCVCVCVFVYIYKHIPNFAYPFTIDEYLSSYENYE